MYTGLCIDLLEYVCIYIYTHIWLTVCIFKDTYRRHSRYGVFTQFYLLNHPNVRKSHINSQSIWVFDLYIQYITCITGKIIMKKIISYSLLRLQGLAAFTAFGYFLFSAGRKFWTLREVCSAYESFGLGKPFYSLGTCQDAPKPMELSNLRGIYSSDQEEMNPQYQKWPPSPNVAV